MDEIYLETLPLLLEDYEPDLVDLPLFLIRLATEVDWLEEKSCFDSICKEISLFYSIKNKKHSSGDAIKEKELTILQKSKELWIIENILYNSFKSMLLPNNDNEKQKCFKLVDLSKLYKVFERC
jgi:DNA mismatch repair protein MLH1